MDGRRANRVRPVIEGMAPKLDVLLHGSTTVNRGRAERCASIAAPGPTASATRLAGPAEVQRLKAASSARPAAPDVAFSLFLRLDADLDPAVRAAAKDAICDIATRATWKRDVAALEVDGPRVAELHAVRGVSYVEPGQTLRGPQAQVRPADTGPSPELRHVTAEERRHRNGRDVLVGIIDVGGFDFAHEDFLGPRRSTRWVSIWDQGGDNRPPPNERHEGTGWDALGYGSEILHDDMDAAIAAAPKRRMAATSLEPQSVMTPGSHGTHVASIAAGNRGVARRAHLAGVLVTLRPEDQELASSFYDSTRIADAVEYLLLVAAELGDDDGPLPVSINISLGTNGHAHDTSSPMARWIDNALATPGRCVSVAAGNAGQVEPLSPNDRGYSLGRIHAGGRFAGTNLRQELGWIVVDDLADVSDNELEIWYSPQDRIDVEVRPPGGDWIGPVHPGESIRSRALDNGTVLSVHSETYYPANGSNRISVLLSPFYGKERDGVRTVGPIAPGEWRIRLTATVVRDGRYDAWIERDDPRRLGAGQWDFPSYFAPGTYTDDRTISSLACAERLLSVANVDSAANAAHVSSSRGPTRDGRDKPDISAVGTRVVAAKGFDRFEPWIEMTGTSMASPQVCGVAALMLGISPRLTSAQIIGMVRTTSTPLPGHDFAWRNDTGFGLIDPAACVAEAARFHRPRPRRTST